MRRQAIVRWATFVLIVAAGVGLFMWFDASFGPFDWGEIFSSREALQEFVSRFHPYGPLAFFMVQTLQVIVAPIPGNITALAGGAIFGLWWGFAISTAGLVVGSSIAFAVERFVPAQVIDKYLDSTADRHFVTLFILFLLPFFPDDALCFISGLSKLRFHVFLIFVLVGRPAGMFVSSLVGAGIAVVPWWGWALIVVGSAGLFWLGYRYRDTLHRVLGIDPPDHTAGQE
ncbi:MAG: TVP38/TMEM64 family protein [Spirochaetota bacterium]